MPQQTFKLNIEITANNLPEIFDMMAVYLSDLEREEHSSEYLEGAKDALSEVTEALEKIVLKHESASSEN